MRYLRRDQEQGLLGTLGEAFTAGAISLLPLREAWQGLEEELGQPLVLVLDQVEEVHTRPQADPAHEWAEPRQAI